MFYQKIPLSKKPRRTRPAQVKKAAQVDFATPAQSHKSNLEPAQVPAQDSHKTYTSYPHKSPHKSPHNVDQAVFFYKT